MTTAITAAADWRQAHTHLLDGARSAIRSRAYWSAFPETPSGKIYGETANADGRAAFEARLGRPFALEQPATIGSVGGERSPYGIELGITYPRGDVEGLVAAAAAATASWSALDVEVRTGIVLEILARLSRASFELAYATMHSTGQGFMMAFGAGGPNAQDRALEAIAYAYDEMMKIPAEMTWEKPQGKGDPLRISKRFRVVPRGVAVAIACSTFPNWNTYPGMFASLVTGNAIIVKPHPLATLPLAITVAIARDVLRDAGCDPNTVLLAADSAEAPIAKTLVMRREVAIVDYTGGPAFGEWLETNVEAQIYTEKAGVNAIVVDSTDDFAGMTRNIATSLSLYSGQMCTAPQNIYVPQGGIEMETGRKTFDEVVAGITGAVDALTSAGDRAAELLGAIVSDATLARLDDEGTKPGVVLASRSIAHSQFPDARIRTPLVVRVASSDRDRYDREMFGPIAYAVETAATAQSLELATRSAKAHGAITMVVYSTDSGVLERAEACAADAGVSLAENLTGALLVNQSVAYSDFHVSGANPAGNASLTDAAFVANRFRVIETRVPVRA